MREQLIRIYNTLLEIHTKGEDTLVMADCLRALKKVIIDDEAGLTKEDKDGQ